MNGAGKRVRNTKKLKTDIPTKVPRKWTDEEMESLLECLKENGHKNFDQLQNAVPSRNLENIRCFMRTVYDTAGKLSEEHPTLDTWINRCTSKSLSETAWKDSLQIAQIIKYLSIDGLLENHPPPEQCQGINFSEAYRLIYQALMGYPVQPVNEQTAKFIQETIKEIKNEIRKEADIVSNVKEFLVKKFSSENSTSSDKTSIATANTTGDDNLGCRKPTKVYQRKKPSQKTITAETGITPIQIVVQGIKNDKSESSGTQNFSVVIEGNSEGSESTVLKVPVPIRRDPRLNINQDEQELLKSISYNPFQIPDKWLEEPVYLNLRQKL